MTIAIRPITPDDAEAITTLFSAIDTMAKLLE
jgi:hypothetical protein